MRPLMPGSSDGPHICGPYTIIVAILKTSDMRRNDELEHLTAENESIPSLSQGEPHERGAI